MPTRSVLVAAIASTLFACTMAPASGSTPQQGASSKENTATGDKTSAPTDSTAPTTTTTATLDGTWDITADGLAASSLTVTGNKVTGTLVYDDEGTSPDGVCPITQDRTTVSLTISGDTMTGTFTKNLVLGGDPNECLGDVGTSNITATRTHAAANANGQTPVEGAWVVQPDANDAASPFAISVAGLAAQIWDSPQQDNKDMDISVKSGAATGTYAGDNAPGQAFAARKR